MKIVMIMLPAFAIVFFVALKLPDNIKTQFFKLPIWITSSIFALFIGHAMKGVMGPVSAIVCDFTLMPLFGIVKKIHDHKMKNRPVIYQPNRKQNTGPVTFLKPNYIQS